MGTEGHAPLSLDTFLQLAKQYRVDSLRAESFEVHFGPLAHIRQPSKTEADDAIGPEDDAEAMCACGHSLETEHNEAGCLVAGCTSLAKCGSTETKAKGVNG